MSRKYILLISIFLLLCFIVACGPVFDQPTLLNNTQTVFDRAIVETITARAIQQGNSGHELATSFANATALSQTITAQAVLKNASYPVTVTAVFPVWEELRHYGVSPFDGDVAWLHKPVTITLSGPNQFGYANDYPQITAKDFVLASDVTWNTNNGLSGCGFMFRSDGNSAGPNQLMVLITRFAEGTVAFSATAGGNVTNMKDYYPWTKDKSFTWQNDATNRLVIVARANLIDIYTNGVLITEVDTTKPPPTTINLPVFPQLPANLTAQQLLTYQQMLNQYNADNPQLSAQLALAQQNYYSNKISPLSDGFLGFAASSSSGTAECKFSNAWLFLYNQPPTPTTTPAFNVTPSTTSTTTLTPTASP
jgi:Flp pilus assembly protein TadG